MATKILNRFCGVLAVLAAMLLIFNTFSTPYSIVTRQLKLPTPVWVVQFNEYSLLWITFLGTAWVLSRDKHVSIQLLTQRLRKRGRTIASLIRSLTGLALCGVLCWFAILTTWDHYTRKVIDVGSVDFPKSLVLAVIPLGFLLLTLQFGRKIGSDWSALRDGKTAPTLEEEGR